MVVVEHDAGRERPDSRRDAPGQAEHSHIAAAHVGPRKAGSKGLARRHDNHLPTVMITTASTNSQYADTTPNIQKPTR